MTLLSPSMRTSLRLLKKNKVSAGATAVLGAVLFVAVFGAALAPYNPGQVGVGPTTAAPSPAHLLGTDDLGRDVFSRILAGTRASVAVGLSAAMITTLIGVLVGATAGYFGGTIDDVLMRITEIFQVIPRFFLAVLMVAFFGANLLNIIFAIAILSWPETARIVRSEFLSLRSRQFVSAARIAGASTATLIFLEILPNALGPVVVNATLQVGQAMILEAGLSYLGLADRNQVSLGLMLFEAQQFLRSAWWMSLFPGAVITLVVLSLNLLGDSLNDLIDPRRRGR
ncbi:Dipeptide transport system permease protein DppC [Rhizobiaceae bacterium]|nr:Dipeptide transport system permease protein DppC [Rhizobiaceae bacterium]